MKFRRLPQLHTLEAFEASARHLSFKLAAKELYLTASAISHQIKTLELQLGIKLFSRGNRSLELTKGGEEYFALVRDTLGRLREGSQRLAKHGARTTLRVSMGPFFASEIIFPALPAFQDAHPDIDVRIDTDQRKLDGLHEDIDIALRFTNSPSPQLTAELLMTVLAVPVCAPAPAKILGKRGISELAETTLIHSSLMPGAWAMWARAAQVTLGTPKRDLWLDSYFSILDAAEDGLGLALGMVPLRNPTFKSRKLVMVWPQLKVEIPQGYYLMHRPEDSTRPEIIAFCHWLREHLKSESLFG